MLTRRSFLKSTVSGASLVALAPSVPSFLARSLQAQTQTHDGRILVVIELNGGNDGINTVVPFADEGYARHRKALRLPADRLHKLSDEVGLHPSMRAAADLVEDGRLAIVQGVGYPNPNRSHFRSMAIWQSARFDEHEHARRLAEFSGALQALLDDLRAARLDDRVVVLAFSEFGRRVAENGSQGTDHGTAGPVFVAGPAVRSGLIGEAPRLDVLEGGDLRMSIDFRSVYAVLISQWLRVPAGDVLDGDFEPLALFAN